MSKLMDAEYEPYGVPKLPRWGRYRVPWFVTVWNGETPEFRVVEETRVLEAVKHRLCWVCGEELHHTRWGRYSFAVGPMCTVNRISAEPPQHRACAIFAATRCPFLTDPDRGRRAGGIAEQADYPDSGMILRNPGVTAIWSTKKFRTVRPEKRLLFQLGNPQDVLWYARGRVATRAEVIQAFDTGCPTLEQMARDDGPEAHELFKSMYAKARRYWPDDR